LSRGKARLEPNTVCVPIDLTLRSHHLNYLELLAERHDTNLSRAFGMLVEEKMTELAADRPQPPRKARMHMTFIVYHLEMLDQLAERLGLCRSEAARRLIDDALARDPAL